MTTMLAARKHFSVAVDWKQRTIEQWLEQYGAWLLVDDHYVNLGVSSTLGHLIDQEAGVIHADFRRRSLPRCNISVFEAMAIEDMLEHVHQTESSKVKQWLKVVTMYYIEGRPEVDIAHKLDTSMYAVKRDKMMGVLRLATRFKISSYLTD
ncbi:antiterminator Q family protein [Acinetobacter sp. ANC 4641]|uniref:antiterminator Q family protein n=1 Tax=Acinetobacter sp. ANC 4641 TaxID=2529847 RepID=UPI0010406BB2|nr:antiterminator Q family protein [Acinetobacter sp. ANC 4641]TCB12652.1 hypothetical protein E0H78_05560 [Acinetobacter sp. ANC 4641]